MSNLELARSIDSKSVCGPIKTIAKNYKDGEQVDLYTIIGKTDSIKTGNTDKGDWVAFIGEFEAVCLTGDNKGQRFAAPKAYFPEPYQSAIFAAIRNGEGAAVEVAVTVGIKIDDTSVVGYAYTTKSLVQLKASDALAALREKMLAAPEVAALMPPAETAAEEAPAEKVAKPAKK